MKSIGLWLICFFTAAALFAQSDENYGTGLLFDHVAFEREVEMTAEFSNDGRRAGDLPRWFSLRPYTPYPKNQGDINSCIGWAMGYAALTTQEAFRKGLTDRRIITKNAYSALFIYNQVKEGTCSSGAYVQNAAYFLKNRGDCKSTDFDFPYTDCERQPEEQLLTQSKENTIKDFVALFKKDTPAKIKVMRTKRSIAEGKPVVIGMRIRESLKKVNGQNPVWKPRATRDRNLGGHALSVIGYNDSLGIFEIMNSWGKEWGDHGFFFVSYKDFVENSVQGIQLVLNDLVLTESEMAAIQERKIYAYEKQQKAQYVRQQAVAEEDKAKQIQELAKQAKTQTNNPEKVASAETLLEQAQALLDQAADQKIQAELQERAAQYEIKEAELLTSVLAGDFLLRQPLTDEYGTLLQDANGNFQFENIQALWNGQYYELNKKDWEEGDMFQVMARNIKKDTYVYLFSVDGNNKAEIHWPRNQRFEADLNGQEATGAGEGALVGHNGAEILIPGNDRVLVRENLKNDFICVLYSHQRIDDFQQRINQLRDEYEGLFMERLQKAFKDILVPTDQITYDVQTMRCSLEKLEQGFAIPLVIKIENRKL